MEQQGLSVPSRDVESLDRIAAGVGGLRVLFVNVFALGGPAGWVLVDTGLRFSAGRIRRWAAREFGASSRPRAILLTHGHFDHVGTVRELAAHWNVPVYAHPLEMPYLTGRSSYPPPDPGVGGGLMACLSDLYPRGPIDLGSRVRPLPEDGSVPYLQAWRWIPTPGHSAGHVSFFREEDRVLIAGDAFVTTRQESLVAALTQRPELHGPPAYHTSDWDAAQQSVERLAGLMPAVIACGHGRPMAGPEVLSALEYLASHFDALARPAHGRYARRPAVTDERGVVSLPPRAPAHVRNAALVGLGVAAAGTVLVIRARRRAA